MNLNRVGGIEPQDNNERQSNSSTDAQCDRAALNQINEDLPDGDYP